MQDNDNLYHVVTIQPSCTVEVLPIIGAQNLFKVYRTRYSSIVDNIRFIITLVRITWATQALVSWNHKSKDFLETTSLHGLHYISTAR